MILIIGGLYTTGNDLLSLIVMMIVNLIIL